MIVGIGIGTVILGSISIAFAIILIMCGIIRIKPIIEIANTVLNWFFPKINTKMAENLRQSFPITGEFPEERGIYIFHPHGLFSLAHFFHVGTQVTDWPIREICGTAVSWMWWVPFGRELLESINFVSTDYSSMKDVLERGKSISVSLGGIKEILMTENGRMKLNIGNKKGIFRMAIETGTPLIPILAYGENELYEIQPGLEWLVKYGIIIPIPSIRSCINWFSLINAPLDNPVSCVIGAAVEVGEVRKPTEKEVDELREKYISALKKLYKETRPSSYSEKLEIV